MASPMDTPGQKIVVAGRQNGKAARSLEEVANAANDLDARRQLQIARQVDRITAFLGYLTETGKLADFGIYSDNTKHTRAVDEWVEAFRCQKHAVPDDNCAQCRAFRSYVA